MRRASAPERRTGRITGATTTKTPTPIATPTMAMVATTSSETITTTISARAFAGATKTATTVAISMAAARMASTSYWVRLWVRSSSWRRFVDESECNRASLSLRGECDAQHPKGVGKHGGILSVSGRLHQAVELEETDALDNGSGEILTQVIVTRSVLSAPRREYLSCVRTDCRLVRQPGHALDHDLESNYDDGAMTNTQEIQSQDAVPVSTGYQPSLKFAGSSDFQIELRRRIDEFFRSTGRRERDCPQMYLKTAILIASFAALYALLVFIAETWWQALPLAIALGLVTAEIGFNVQHDGSHHAYSNYDWVNKIMAMTLDVLGGSESSMHWQTFIHFLRLVIGSGQDTDIVLGGLGRLSPHRRRLWFYRWQQYYLWPLYGFMAINWHLV